MPPKISSKLTTSPGAIYGPIGSAMNPQIVTDYGAAFASLVGKGPVVVGRDGRVTGEHYARSIISAMNAVGLEVYALGMAPSATLAMAARELNCSGAVSITPGALPEEYSGLKFFDANGALLDKTRFDKLQSLAKKRSFKHVTADRVGKFRMDYSCLGRHIQCITEIPAINLMDINRAQMTVVVDCGNASGAAVLPEFLRCIGLKVIELNCRLGAGYSRKPDIKSTRDLSAEVKTKGANLGVIVDADGSRVNFVDEKGKALSIEQMLALALRQVAFAHPKSAIGIQKGKLTGIRKYATALDLTVWDSTASESDTLSAMKKRKASAALFEDGAILYAAGTPTFDALINTSLALSTIASSRKPLSALVSELSIK